MRIQNTAYPSLSHTGLVTGATLWGGGGLWGGVNGFFSGSADMENDLPDPNYCQIHLDLESLSV